MYSKQQNRIDGLAANDFVTSSSAAMMLQLRRSVHRSVIQLNKFRIERIVKN